MPGKSDLFADRLEEDRVRGNCDPGDHGLERGRRGRGNAGSQFDGPRTHEKRVAAEEKRDFQAESFGLIAGLNLDGDRG
jgi:hypothetical protein